MESKMLRDRLQAFGPYIIFGIFFVLLCIQYSKVDVYYDDFGYYSLTHGTNAPGYGTDHTFAEIFSYLGHHYMGTNGRLLYALMWLTIYKFGGLNAVRLSGVIIVTAVWVVMHRIITDHKKAYDPTVTAVIMCFCFALFGISLQGKCTYWFAAFYTYYTPLISLGIFAIMYEKHMDDLNWKQTMVMCILMFLASWGGEALSAATVAATVLLAGYDSIKHKRADIKKLLFILPALVGFLLLYLAPGIHLRSSTFVWEGSTLGYIFANAVTTFKFFFSNWNHDYVLYMMAGSAILGFVLFIKRRNLIDLICSIGIIGIALVIFIQPALIPEVLLNQGVALSFITMGIISVSLVIPLSRYYWFRGDMSRIIMLGTTFISIVALSGSPDRSYRVFVPFCVSATIIIVDACFELWNLVRGENDTLKTTRVLATATLGAYIACMLIFGTINAITIYRGYCDNHPINLYNDAAYRQAKADIDAGKEVKQIHLMKLKDEKYAGAVVYQETWFKPYIDHYYELPDEVEYVFDVPNE